MMDARAAPPAVPMRDTFSDTFVATDSQGRALPNAAECGPPKKNRTVGIFYFTWLDARHDGAGLLDNSKLIAANPTDPQYGPPGAFHWWGEPYLGYYHTEEEYIIRKHAQMLTDAGVDVIICDVTNAITYENVYLAICRTYSAMRKEGRPTPQIAFIANSNSAATVQKLYEEFYTKNLYPDLWFRWNGKPLLLTPPDGLTQPIRDFFTIRHSWAWSDPGGWFGDGNDKWCWIDNHPQNYGWHESKDRPEQISVCTAQHATSNIGRSFHAGKEPPPAERNSAAGLCFAEQWERALKVDPEFVFITGWNEWVAQRFVSGPGGGPGFLGRTLKEGETFFVDQYNQEFSRDIEPMRGGHGDDYYYQMVAGIRRYKGVRPAPKATAPKTIRLSGAFSQWNAVGPEFRDDSGDTTHRDHDGWKGAGHYTNATGRNDFETMKVARDEKNLTFYVRTKNAITPPDDASNWMTLLINADNDPKTGWEGYDFAVRRAKIGGRNVMALCRNRGGKWDWEPIAPVETRLQGNEMHLSFPRAALGLTPEKPLRLDFKWTDNLPAAPTAIRLH